jgi:hypothetical protein
MDSKLIGSAATLAVAVSGCSGEGGARQKVGNNVFQSGQVHLHIEFRNKSCCCRGKMGTET